MRAAIITIGDEILNGQIVDTNSSWIANQLTALHIPLFQVISIADTSDAIRQGLDQAAEGADIILVTGGLGPTKDDVTKSTIASYFHSDIIRNQEVLEHVSAFFTKLGFTNMPEINKQQADVLSKATVLFNDVGTAPGMAIEEKGKYYMFMPGVPYEMKYLMENRVIPILKSISKQGFIYNSYILTVGIGESHLASAISSIEEALPAFIKLAYLPRLGAVLLRLTAQGDNEKEVIRQTEYFAKEIQRCLGEHVVCLENSSFERVIVERFVASRCSFATAESCTGGAIASSLTAIAGASGMFQGGAVVYSNTAKVDILGVNEQTLMRYGAVSEQTAVEMANGAKKVYKSDYAIATTGIAGPSGGTADKPVGTVCIAVGGRQETVVKTFYFKNDRAVNIERTRMAGLTTLWKLFQKEQSL